MKTYEDFLREYAQQNDSLVVMTAENRAAIRNLPPHLGNRFIDVGICEQTMVGMAAGLALRGRKPVIHALATFLTLRAFEFIRTDIGIPGLPVTLVGGVPGFLSDGNGPTHQAIEDISILRGIPNMQVFCPADAVELAAGIPSIIDSGKPCYIRYYGGPAVVDHQPFEYGKAEWLATGTDVALLSYGFLIREVMSARKKLEAAGYSVSVINMRMLSPVDEETILRAGRSHQLVVTIEDHFLKGGLYSIVSEVYMKYLYDHNWGSSETLMMRETNMPYFTYHEDYRLAKVYPIALENRWFKPALLDRVLDHEGFTGEKLAHRIQTELKQKSILPSKN
ncbi:MAG: transketolase [Bacteroidetes bacterium]|nr:transketolase [Bacteroidota bacterium]